LLSNDAGHENDRGLAGLRFEIEDQPWARTKAGNLIARWRAFRYSIGAVNAFLNTYD
jgi:hypothetical protein